MAEDEKNDPLWEAVVELQTRVASLETEMSWVKKGMESLDNKFEEFRKEISEKITSIKESLAKKIDDYKKWIISSVVGSVLLATFIASLLSYLAKVMGA